MLHGCLRSNEHSFDFHGDHPIEVLVVELVDRGNGQESRVVHENVEGAAERLGSLGDCCTGRIRIGGISLDGECFAAGRFDGANDLLCLGRSSAIRESDRCPVGREALHDRGPDSTRSTCNERGLTCHSFGHVLLLYECDLEVDTRLRGQLKKSIDSDLHALLAK